MKQARRNSRVYKCHLVRYLGFAGLTIAEIVEATGFRIEEVQDLSLRRVHPKAPPIDKAELEARAKQMVERLKLA